MPLSDKPSVSVVLGHTGGVVVACTFTRARALASASVGWYSSSMKSSASFRPRMPPAAFWASNASVTPSFMSVPSSCSGPEMGALMPICKVADAAGTQATSLVAPGTTSHTLAPQSPSVEQALGWKSVEQAGPAVRLAPRIAAAMVRSVALDHKHVRTLPS